jgi:hypothetical protein
MASNNRYVQPNAAGGWDIVKEGHHRATAHADTKAKAVARARALTRRDGGGEIRIMNATGKMVASDTVRRVPGRQAAA